MKPCECGMPILSNNSTRMQNVVQHCAKKDGAFFRLFEKSKNGIVRAEKCVLRCFVLSVSMLSHSFVCSSQNVYNSIDTDASIHRQMKKPTFSNRMLTFFLCEMLICIYKRCFDCVKCEIPH